MWSSKFSLCLLVSSVISINCSVLMRSLSLYRIHVSWSYQAMTYNVISQCQMLTCILGCAPYCIQVGAPYLFVYTMCLFVCLTYFYTMCEHAHQACLLTICPHGKRPWKFYEGTRVVNAGKNISNRSDTAHRPHYFWLSVELFKNFPWSSSISFESRKHAP